MPLTVQVQSIVGTSAGAGGVQSGSKAIGPVSIVGANQVDQITELTLLLGDNAIAVPQNPAATGVVVQLPSGNAQAIALKGAGADIGIRINKTGTIVLHFDPTALPASIILNAAVAMAAGQYVTLSWF